jgi:hypothetical protein
MARYCCLIVAALVLSGAAAAADELTPAKRADIRKLMEVTGSANIANQFAAAISQNLFKTMKAARTDIPDRALEIMNRELVALFSERLNAPGGLMEKTIPIYDKHFTHAEIKELLAFYQTAIGKKAIAVLPKILSESMMVGQQWGASLAPEIEKRVAAALKKEGLLPQAKP